MTEQNFYDLSHRWEENEIFYKTLYENALEGETAYQDFVAGLDKKELLAKGIYVPGLIEPYRKFDEGVEVFKLNFDIAVWKHSRYTPPYWHKHEYFEVVCVMEGTVRHRIDEGETFEMIPGDICILPDKTKHALEAMSDDSIVINIMLKKSTFQYAFFDILSIDNVISGFFQDTLYGNSNAPYLFFRTAQNDDIRRCIERLFVENYNRLTGYDKLLKSGVIELFVYLLRGYEQYFVPGDRGLEMEIIKYLKDHATDARLETAAQHFNYSTAYFSRLVRKLTGLSFSELLKNQRMDMACRLLRETSMPIGQIHALAGYNTLEHFNRSFKKRFRQTPSQYRKEQQGEG